jgi:WD40 repeat protein
MYLGKRPWPNGAVAGSACDDYFAMARVPLPETMRGLLRRCLAENRDERPHDFAEIENELLGIYGETSGEAYPRESPKAAADTADSLNNRALSFIDLGKPEEAEKCWEKALEADPNHEESPYNRALYLWQNARIDDTEALRTLEANRLKKTDYCLGKLHIARGDAESAVVFLNKAKDTLGETEDIKKDLSLAQELIDTGKDGRCIFNFEGHTDVITSVCITRDGKYMLSGSGDETVKLWDITTRKCILTLGHTNTVLCVNFCPDGKHVAAMSVNSGGAIKIWDITDGTCVKTIEGFSEWNNSMCVSPDGKNAIVGYDFMIQLWDLETKKVLNTFEEHTGEISSLCYSSDGKYVLSGSYDKTIKLWDISKGKCVRTFEGHTDGVCSACFSPDEKKVLSGGRDCTIRYWDLVTGKCIYVYKGHKSHVDSVCFSPDGKRALSGGLDKTIKYWDLSSGVCIRTFEGHSDYVTSVCFAMNGSHVVSGSCDGTVKFWALPTIVPAEMIVNRVQSTETSIQKTNCFNRLTMEIKTLVLNKNIPAALTKLGELKNYRDFGSYAAYFSSVRELSKYCINGSGIICKVIKEIPCEKADQFAVTTDGQFALICDLMYNENVLNLYDLIMEKCVRTLEGHTDRVISACFSPDGTRALSGSLDQTIKLWNIIDGDCICTVRLGVNTNDAGKQAPSIDSQAGTYPQEPAHRLAGEPLGRFGPGNDLFVGGMDPHNIHTLQNDDTPPQACELCGGESHYLELLEAGYYDNLAEDNTGSGVIGSLCCSTDGKKALSGSTNGELKLWDLVNENCIYEFEKQPHSIKGLNFSPSAKQFVSGGETLSLWDIARGKPVWKFEEYTVCACFSPNGKKLVSGHGECTVKLWDLSNKHCIFTLTSGEKKVSDVCFSPDGKKLLFNSGDYATKLLDVETGKCIFTFTPDKNTGRTRSVRFSPQVNRFYVLCENALCIFDLEFALIFPGWHDWDEGARPYLEIFKTLHPNWTEDDFNNILIPDLRNRGYGWLAPEGVRKKLEEM